MTAPVEGLEIGADAGLGFDFAPVREERYM
jgi:hypothetical protein